MRVSWSKECRDIYMIQPDSRGLLWQNRANWRPAAQTQTFETTRIPLKSHDHRSEPNHSICSPTAETLCNYNHTTVRGRGPISQRVHELITEISDKLYLHFFYSNGPIRLQYCTCAELVTWYNHCLLCKNLRRFGFAVTLWVQLIRFFVITVVMYIMR